MSRIDKVRKPIKRARLKLWRHSVRKASLHVASGGDTREFSSAKWRQPLRLRSSPRIQPPERFAWSWQTGCERRQAIP